jgi:hypothetical protein
MGSYGQNGMAFFTPRQPRPAMSEDKILGDAMSEINRLRTELEEVKRELAATQRLLKAALERGI